MKNILKQVSLIFLIFSAFPVSGESFTFASGTLLKVKGILQYSPLAVKSVEAWHGYEFKIGALPLLPQTPEQKTFLQKNIGQEITVDGTWFGGDAWHPDPRLPSPVGQTVRGYGLQLEKITTPDSQNNSLTRKP